MSFTPKNWVCGEVISSDDLNRMEQGIADSENISKYSSILTLVSEKTHEGLRCFTTVYCPQNMVMVFASQVASFNPNSGNFVSRYAIHVPDKYTSGKHHAYIIADLNATEYYELTEENAPQKANVILDYNCSCHFYVCNITPNRTDVGNQTLFRIALELYDDNGNLERVVYSAQTAVTKTEDAYLAREVFHPTYSDSIVQGFYVLHKADACIQVDNKGIKGLDYLDNHTNDSFMSDVFGSSQSVLIAPNGYSRTIPWDKLHGTAVVVCPLLLTGDDRHIVGNRSHAVPSFELEEVVSNGQTFCYDGLWYTATADIAQGEKLVLGTNCTAVKQPVLG